ncbi:DUF2971 domain-containing protein [Klebsiella pneumoniae]|nr:DUF2971 domain-containing protein [Klebsiella pneumoniae]
MSDFPSIFYKYRKFDTFSMDALVNDKVYFSDPNNFNDPLDCKPHIDFDIQDKGSLHEILSKLLYQDYFESNLSKYNNLKYDCNSIHDFNTMISLHAYEETKGFIIGLTHNIKEEHEEIDAYKHCIHILIMKRIGGKGVFSLAGSFDCPLMWSHYGDEHKGFCIGYKRSENIQAEAFSFFHNIQKIKYSLPRTILSSKIYQMVNQTPQAETEIDDAIYFRKSPKWCYENEYRMIGHIGLHKPPLELSEITFGLKCPESIQHIIINSLRKHTGLNFYVMTEIQGSFNLERKLVAFY